MTNAVMRGAVAAAVVALTAACADLGARIGFGGDPAPLERQAEAGDPAAQTALGARLEKEGDMAGARRWYETAAALGHAPAQFRLGDMLAEGRGVRSDPVRAAAWLMRAAEQGEPAAQAALGRLYERGQGVPQDYGKAAEWYDRAARQWQTAPPGTLPDRGAGAAASDAEEAKWIRRAAELGVAEAQYELGQAYEDGRGVPRDMPLAAQWYQAAAGRGHPLAAAALSRIDPDNGDPLFAAPDDAAETAMLATPAEPARGLDAGYRIHLASYRSADDADAGWSSMLQRHGDLLEGLQVEIARVDLSDRGVFWRVQAGPLDSAADAERLCLEFARRQTYCQPVTP